MLVPGNGNRGGEVNDPADNSGENANNSVLNDPLRLLHLIHFHAPPAAFCRLRVEHEAANFKSIEIVAVWQSDAVPFLSRSMVGKSLLLLRSDDLQITIGFRDIFFKGEDVLTHDVDAW